MHIALMHSPITAHTNKSHCIAPNTHRMLSRLLFAPRARVVVAHAPGVLGSRPAAAALVTLPEALPTVMEISLTAVAHVLQV